MVRPDEVRCVFTIALAIALVVTELGTAAADATVTVGANVSLTRAVGNQSVAAIAIDPTSSRCVFVVSQDETARLCAARTSDGRAMWTGGSIATGAGRDGLPASCCNPSV